MNDAVRADFPLLKRTFDGRPVVYLDSAATALKPQRVLDAERLYSTQFTANIHRGKHALSDEASNAFEQSRKRVARWMNSDPDQVIFTKNTSESINTIAAGIGFGPQDTVLLSMGEHHSNIVPWLDRAKVQWLESDPLKPLDPDQVEAAMRKHKPRVFSFGLASNVTGIIQPAAALCAAARRCNVLSVIDAAQGAPHMSIDVEKLGCDLLAFSGHKILAPTGIGILWGTKTALEKLRPLTVGGGTIDRVSLGGFTSKKTPYRFEAGTPNVSGVLGLSAALDYLENIGLDVLAAHEEKLATEIEKAVTDLPGVRVLMASGKSRLAIATLCPLSDKVSPDHLALILSDSHQMMVRSGFHCAHPLFDLLQLKYGGVRVSAYLYNTVEEVQRFGVVLRSLLTRMLG